MVFVVVADVEVISFSSFGFDGFSRSSVKLWKLDLSLTTIRYLPALSVLTFLPPFFNESVKPGPTTPFSVGVGEPRLNAPPATATGTPVQGAQTTAALRVMCHPVR